MTVERSKHGTLGDFSPAGSGADLADAAMTRWERSEPKTDRLSPSILVYGDFADGGVTIEEYSSKLDGRGEHIDQVEKSINVGAIEKSARHEGKDYKFLVSLAKEHSRSVNVFVACGDPDQSAALVGACKEVIGRFSPNSGAMARELVIKLEALGIDCHKR
jgi:hypothetical protein